MPKLTSSPLLTKLIYISKNQSKTQDKDKYADYIQRGNKKSLISNISAAMSSPESCVKSIS